MSLTATNAELSRITANGKRQACLSVDFSDGTFMGSLIEVAGYHGGGPVPEERVRGWLLGNAQEALDFACKVKGAASTTVKWES